VGSKGFPTFGTCRQSILAVKKLTVCSKFDRIASQTPPWLQTAGLCLVWLAGFSHSAYLELPLPSLDLFQRPRWLH
jgi:hypothetical protein